MDAARSDGRTFLIFAYTKEDMCEGAVCSSDVIRGGRPVSRRRRRRPPENRFFQSKVNRAAAAGFLFFQFGLRHSQRPATTMARPLSVRPSATQGRIVN